ncbi:MAG: M16 family metallopeptidase [bacterium]
MRKVSASISLVIAFFLSFSIVAQENTAAKLPFDANVTKGKLDNGLTYYIRENKKPEKKVELRLVIKTGSIMEDDDQQGLAHMAEHMAFNGTKNFKKNDIVSYLQSIGVEFGNDLNAYTSFDETVYILPIPTDQPSNLEKGFQILEDWAHQVTYLDEDINSERAIILEESRVGKSGEERMFKKIYPELFKGSKYGQRLPIGIDSIIKTFNPNAIRRFYQDWYRPDLMAVIVVGDISKADAIKYITKHFSSIRSASIRKRDFASVPAYAENKAMVVTDKEATGFEFSINYPAMPFQNPQNIGEYRKELFNNLYTSLLSNRLRELTQKENPPFVYAGASFGSYAKNYQSFSIQGSTGTSDVQKGIEATLIELERVKRFGFTEPELERARKNILTAYERSWNNRDKTESSQFADEYIRNFTDNEAVPGIDAEYQMIKQLLPTIKLSEVNGITDLFKNEKNRFTYVMGPTTGAKLPSTENILAMLDAKAKDVTIKPYEEKLVATNLLTNSPKSGKLVSSKKNALLGTTELVLSNGVKVSLKVTDFKNDQILFSASRYGGLSNYSLKDKYSAENAVTMVASMGVGAFSPTDLGKALAGKSAMLRPSISNYSAGFSGNSSKKDIETLFQLLNLYVKEPRKDSALYTSVIQRGKAQVAMLGANPQVAFIDTLTKVLYNNNPLAPTAVPKIANFDKIDLDRSLAIYKERLGDVGGMHISIVGSFDEKEMISLLEKYVAGLPATGKSTYTDNKVKLFTGTNEFRFKKGKEDKSLIIGILHGEIPYAESTALKFSGLGDAMNIIITEEMREKIQGIYGGAASIEYNKIPTGRFQLVLQLPCGPAKVDTLIAAFNHELKKMAESGVAQSYVDKVKKAWLEKYKVDAKTNEYWLSVLQSINRGETTADRILNAEKYFNGLTAGDIKEAAMIVQKASGKMIAVQMPETIKQ